MWCFVPVVVGYLVYLVGHYLVGHFCLGIIVWAPVQLLGEIK